MSTLPFPPERGPNRKVNRPLTFEIPSYHDWSCGTKVPYTVPRYTFGAVPNPPEKAWNSTVYQKTFINPDYRQSTKKRRDDSEEGTLLLASEQSSVSSASERNSLVPSSPDEKHALDPLKGYGDPWKTWRNRPARKNSESDLLQQAGHSLGLHLVTYKLPKQRKEPMDKRLSFSAESLVSLDDSQRYPITAESPFMVQRYNWLSARHTQRWYWKGKKPNGPINGYLWSKKNNFDVLTKSGNYYFPARLTAR